MCDLHILNSFLTLFSSSVPFAPLLCPSCSSTCSTLRSGLSLPRYKFLVQVLIGEQRGAGLRFGARCLWDAKTDSMAEALFMSDSLYCCAAVFAVYLY